MRERRWFMRRVLHLSTVHGAIRARVCAICPARTPGTDDAASDQPRACEATCRPFLSLPRLWSRAVRMDPMVGRFTPAMSRVIGRTETAPDAPRRVTRRGRAFEGVLRELSGN